MVSDLGIGMFNGRTSESQDTMKHEGRLMVEWNE